MKTNFTGLIRCIHFRMPQNIRKVIKGKQVLDVFNNLHLSLVLTDCSLEILHNYVKLACSSFDDPFAFFCKRNRDPDLYSGKSNF